MGDEKKVEAVFEEQNKPEPSAMKKNIISTLTLKVKEDYMNLTLKVRLA